MELQQLLLWCGVIAGPLFIVVFLVERKLRPGYDPIRQPVSALSQGPRGWIQQTNFIVVGAMIAAYAYGLYVAMIPLGGSFWGPVLVLIDGIGLIGAGIFVTDMTNASSDTLIHTKRLRRGVLHDLFSLIFFVSNAIACFVFAHFFADVGARTWELYSILSGVLFAGGFLMFARQFAHRSESIIEPGILQRITIIIGLLWLSAVALYMLSL